MVRPYIFLCFMFLKWQILMKYLCLESALKTVGSRGNLVFVHIGTKASPTLHKAQINVGHFRFVILIRLDVTPCNLTGTYHHFLLPPSSGKKKKKVFKKYQYSSIIMHGITYLKTVNFELEWSSSFFFKLSVSPSSKLYLRYICIIKKKSYHKFKGLYK